MGCKPFSYCCLLVVAFSLVVGQAPFAAPQPTADLQRRAQQVFGVLPKEVPKPANPIITEPQIELGRKLFYEARISKSGTISCNSCHDLARFGVDGEPTSPGHEGKRGGRNSPTVYNAALHIAQFWDGRAADVEEQAKGPILNPIEMGMPSEKAVIDTLAAIPEYPGMFREAFPGKEPAMTYDSLANAIGAFERGLMTPSRFDTFLSGEPKALNAGQLQGLQTFLETGCGACHSGPAIGGNSYQKLGMVNAYDTKDLGRYEVTHQDSDRYVFKVPSLRNIAETGPYFHDGSVKSLGEAIRLMAHHQLGKDIGEDEVQSIETFLGVLTGEVNLEYIAKP